MTWNIMTRTRGGTVSLLKNLTYDEAQGIMQRLRKPYDRGNPWSEYGLQRMAEMDAYNEKSALDLKTKGFAVGRNTDCFVFQCSDGDLEQIECWGPPGEVMVVWPKPEDADEKLARLMPEARRKVGLTDDGKRYADEA